VKKRWTVVVSQKKISRGKGELDRNERQDACRRIREKEGKIRRCLSGDTGGKGGKEGKSHLREFQNWKNSIKNL